MSDTDRCEAYRRGQRDMQDLAARIAEDDDGAFSVWGEDRNTVVAQKTCQDIAAAIRAVTPVAMSDTDRAPTPPADARVAEIRERAEKATPGPWRACEAGACTCGNVWSIPADFPVVTARGGREPEQYIGEAHTYMADTPELIYASIPEEAAQTNATFIAHAREDVPFLLAEVDRLAARVAALEEALRPFANALRAMEPFGAKLLDDDERLERLLENTQITVGDFRRALAEGGGDG